MLLGLGACMADAPGCLRLTRQQAIKLAIKSKSQLRPNETDARKFESDEVSNLELRPISDRSNIGAIVTFHGNKTGQPVALIYGDCYVGWSSTDSTA